MQHVINSKLGPTFQNRQITLLLIVKLLVYTIKTFGLKVGGWVKLGYDGENELPNQE